MAKLCICLTAKSLARNLEILEKYRKHVDLAELRVDCLDPDERLSIRRFPEKANIPVILTIRRDVDGGHFSSGEGGRINLMARGMAYADVDRRKNFAYIDLEDDVSVPSIEEAARTFGTRIIRSYHNIKGDENDISARIRSMSRADDEIIKVGIAPNSTWDVLGLLRAGRAFKGRDKILIAMGPLGVYSRILSEQFGSFLSYASPLAEKDASSAGIGQFDAETLARRYRFRGVTAGTKIYGLMGFPIRAHDNPSFFFNAIFEMENIDAVYVPFPADSITAGLEVAKELGVEGLSITAPYKESIIPLLDMQSPDVEKIGACNTVSRCAVGWLGTNTEGRAFADSFEEFLSRRTGARRLRRLRATVIGAGSVAKAAVFELRRMGAKALVLNRTARKARELALPWKFAWGSLHSHDVRMIGRYCDAIIQATSAGADGSGLGDLAESYSFTGKEKVVDFALAQETTPFLKRAVGAGCLTRGGRDMFVRQAKYQYAQFVGREFPEHLLAKASPVADGSEDWL